MPTKSSLDAADLLDLGDPSVVANPYPAMAALRERAPIAWHSRMGTWLATGHAEAGAVLRDRRLGRVFGPRTPEDDWDTFNWLHADSILDSEPPKHTRLRRLVAGAFGRGHVQRLAPRIEELSAGLLAELPESGPFDVIEEYAEPLPVLVIAELLGVPEADRHHLRPWSQAIVRMYEVDRTPAEEQAARDAAAAFAAYVEELATERAKAPGEDLLTDLVQARDGSDRLSAHELVATAVLLLNAGHEASVNGFGNGLHSWLTAPDRPQVDPRDDAAVERLVEEFLRHDSPLHLFERTAKEPASVAGVDLEPGEKVAALLGAANRDPKVFADPDRFDPTRDPNPHLAFGAGIHFCIGAPLARLELAISLRTLLARHPRLELVEAVQRPTFVLRGFERLVVSPAG
ncbi:cytochrome P450 [Phycicoccus sp. 3266]|uniref:cytochrome P450 n=1 Tax=Phycicoccus sp. 3266 TaxID=2817751 RepID=UPI002854B2FE|nr:cytochrome P450 [Phycicoccus sp. 3266]MDR6863688.1 cytochrome P450 [Phycicoccus sp. 3266]